ncbi:golgi uridine diphosphate-N-acetylglucosamine transporter [Cryomyces antarcticus]|nr:golgi uridine diphosphate-N-acetylglucosamine transporter [Cryomyces antarcticus]
MNRTAVRLCYSTSKYHFLRLNQHRFQLTSTEGLLITFFQFLFTAVAAYPSQASFGKNTSAFGLKPPVVPIKRWALIAAMFWGINMLNNWAFAFNISVPVHIILRSFGSVTTMAAGALQGRRYSALQVVSVALLTVGVGVSAWADASSKGADLSSTASASPSSTTSTTDFTQGLLVLLIAQLLSAYMGIYVQDTYSLYRASWLENLFYSHFLSLPLFLPLTPTLRRQYARLAATPPLRLQLGLHDPFSGATAATSISTRSPLVPTAVRTLLGAAPAGLLYLVLNALTQLACISGVNVLSARSSAVTVTIVLNIRKLVSFLLSAALFGHRFPPAMLLGAALVFGSGALYGWETSVRIPAKRRAGEARDGDGVVREKADEGGGYGWVENGRVDKEKAR